MFPDHGRNAFYILETIFYFCMRDSDIWIEYDLYSL